MEKTIVKAEIISVDLYDAVQTPLLGGIVKNAFLFLEI